jgi:hypothetical protein
MTEFDLRFPQYDLKSASIRMFSNTNIVPKDIRTLLNDIPITTSEKPNK